MGVWQAKANYRDHVLCRPGARLGVYFRGQILLSVLLPEPDPTFALLDHLVVVHLSFYYLDWTGGHRGESRQMSERGLRLDT